MIEEVAALAREHDLSPRCVQAFEDLVRRALAAPRSRSHAPTLIEEPVALVGTPPSEDTPGTERYRDLGCIGVGATGEVRRMLDRELNRTVAMKVIHPSELKRASRRARFIEEAQATAQLQHPGIVPVHELGQLDDGRIYFTMREVVGRELADVIHAVHEASAHTWSPSGDGWTFRRLVAAFHQVCAAVAYAHSRGVVHRDLKPTNLMVGAFGEALVLDWGLAKIRGHVDRAADAGELDAVVTSRSEDDALATRVGTVAGTPAYMAPEQARGEVDAIDARSDVYALGAVLYELLSGRPPYSGDSALTVLAKVLEGPPSAPGRDGFEGGPAPEPPPELVEVCLRAMARDPSHRYQSATELAGAVEAWLDGARKRETALQVVADADARLDVAQELRARADELGAEAARILAAVEPWRPERDKAPGWARQDEADSLRLEADLRDLEHRELLRVALSHAPDLPEAHERLADLHRQAHRAAEESRRPAEQAQAAALMRSHDRTGRYAAYLKGDGALTLVTDPPGAEVVLSRYVRRHRRLVAKEVGVLGRTPLVQERLPMGSYLCRLSHPGRADVRYPVHIDRGAHWDGVRPGDSDPAPVVLPRVDALGPDDCYVPAGWFLAGDDEAHAALPARTRLWCEAFVLRRFPVTNRAYIAFLDDLVARGREVQAQRCAPRERGATAAEPGTVIYGRDDDGRFVLRPDADGDEWQLDFPVLMIDWACASAYARWAAGQTGRPWRLPADFEWEKAARGTDGRIHPWGDGMDPTYACSTLSHRGHRLPQVVDSFPEDCSPYGVRGLGGNTRDWCVDLWTLDGALPRDRIVRPWTPIVAESSARRVARGGVWYGAATHVHAAHRVDCVPTSRLGYVGVRLARPLVAADS